MLDRISSMYVRHVWFLGVVSQCDCSNVFFRNRKGKAKLIKLWAVRYVQNVTLWRVRSPHGTGNAVSALGTTDEKAIPEMASILRHTSVPELNLPLSAKFSSKSHILCVQYVRLYFLLEGADQYWIQHWLAYDYAICFSAWYLVVSVRSTIRLKLFSLKIRSFWTKAH
jgi:hypothetical protein